MLREYVGVFPDESREAAQDFRELTVFLDIKQLFTVLVGAKDD